MVEQHDIFSQQQDATFAELCNALYERECVLLATDGPTQIGLLKQRLKFLPNSVKEVAHKLIEYSGPLEVDIYNGTYQAKQAAKCPGVNQSAEVISAHYQQLPSVGSVLPVLISHLGVHHIELDPIDRIDESAQRIHTNKHGWFSLDGYNIDDNPQCQLLKPMKSVWQAACCGHQWKHKGKTLTRALSMRELKLSFHIRW